MTRSSLFGKHDGGDPKVCDECGTKVLFGIMWVVQVGTRKARACSHECEEKLKQQEANKQTEKGRADVGDHEQSAKG